ncbi:hypothetical protein [Gloeobacter violaceus]|uniref:Gsr3238 protein n=1 Tax=Gloeobacter violaceus (strain ATCC 29082 / PCC 7421) TaxID=251221 RepID=Q7NGD3_GLOVI|nr:hypothetical protein [Gloeobacter violaceus]BAC91179.1 gsr3238 [Gloeobacter violaceus PCC 7421]
MKAVVSISSPVFREAELLAKRLGISRSELYSRAIKAFVEVHKHQGITEALDAVFGEQPGALEPGLAYLQFASLKREDW